MKSLRVVMLMVMLLTGVTCLAQGKLVFRQGGTGNQLWVASDNGANLQLLFTAPSYIISPRWSPDGTHIAFQSGTNLWIINSDGTNPQVVSGVAPIADAGLSWNADGSGIIYGAVRPCHEYLRAVDLTFNLNGTITASNDRVFYDVGSVVGPTLYQDVSPVDPMNPLVAYMRYDCSGASNNNFYGIEIAGDQGVPLSFVPPSPDVFRQQLPRWSSNGQTLLTMVRYLSNNETALEVVQPFNASAPRQVYLRNRGFFHGLDFGCSTDLIFFSWNDGGAPGLNAWRFNALTNTRQRLTNFTSGDMREIDHHCGG